MLIRLAYIIAVILIASISLSAQAFPIALNAIWDKNPPEENVTHYVTSIDGAQSDFSISSCQTQCIYLFSVSNRGPHIFTVRAINEWGSSDLSSVEFTVSPPGKVTIRIEKK